MAVYWPKVWTWRCGTDLPLQKQYLMPLAFDAPCKHLLGARTQVFPLSRFASLCLYEHFPFCLAFTQLPNMIQDRLNDAAIALCRVLDNAQIHFGIFGGYAVAVMGGPRESKDIDCLAAVTKEQAVKLLDGVDGFSVIPQTREDYVAFLWSDQPDRKHAVLVEIFCEQFPGKGLLPPLPLRMCICLDFPFALIPE